MSFKKKSLQWKHKNNKEEVQEVHVCWRNMKIFTNLKLRRPDGSSLQRSGGQSRRVKKHLERVLPAVIPQKQLNIWSRPLTM